LIHGALFGRKASNGNAGARRPGATTTIDPVTGVQDNIENHGARNHNSRKPVSSSSTLESPSAKSQAAEDLQARLSHIERLLSSDPALAEAQAAELLGAVPGHPMALLFQGIARRLMGNPASAIEILGPLCESQPDAPMPHLQLGLSLRETDDNESAAQSLRRAVAIKSDFSDAWMALADLLTAMADTAGADKAFGMYIRYSSRDPRLLEAAAALGENRTAEAESLLRSHLDRHPTDIVALCMLADVLDRVSDRYDRLSEAEALLKRCLELAPGYTRARHNYAVVLLRQNRAPAALQEIDGLLVDEPKNPDFRKLKAAILVRLREYEGSIRICEGLLDEDPNQPTVWTSLGHMLKSIGRRDGCVEAYRKAIELVPQFGEPYWSLANLKTYRITGPELESMRLQLNKSDLSEVDRTHFHFAMGKALEDRGEFAESFRNYAEANRLRLKNNPYNAQELTDHIRRSKALFTTEFFAERAAHGAGASDPIFVLGLPRSGSTLVEQILSSHSAVEGTMELPDIAAIAKSLDKSKTGPDEEKYPEALASMDQGTLRKLGDSYIEQTCVQRKLDRPYFIDKMPNNFAHVGLIHLILPNACIIDVRRHPLACGLSLFKEHFARAQNFSYSLEEIGLYYRNYVEIMAHFNAVLPGRVYRVIYESLVNDTETEVRRLLEYCGLPFEESCLNFYENKRPVSTASSEQVRTPIFRDGLDHWRHYEPWLDPLKAQLGSLVETYAGAPDQG
jgi:tetratricopeptide (TPR) repeat protein